MNVNAPSHYSLVELWMSQHYDGIPAVVFFTPGHFETAGAIGNLYGLGPTERAAVSAGEIFVRDGTQPQGESLDDFVNHLQPEIYGYVAAWDGHTFTTENT